MKNKIGLILLLAPVLLCGDIIYLNKGEEYEGRLIKIEKNNIWFNIQGKIKKWTSDEVQRIEFEELHSAQKIEELGDSLIDSLLKYKVDDYQDIQYLTLYEKVTYCINPDSSWKRTSRIIQKLLKPGGRWIASKEFYYLSKSEQLKITSAKVIHPDGKINWLREAATKDESIYSKFPVYENQHRIRMALPEIPIGGICDVCVEQTLPKISIEHPLLIEECFRDWEPIEFKTVEIICPTKMEFTIFKSDEIHAQMLLQNGTKIYKLWKTKAQKIEKENWLPPLSDLSPRVVAGLKEQWEVMGDNYYKLMETRLKYSDELINKLNKLQAGMSSTPTAVGVAQKIYNFVATEIKPIPITKFDEYSWLPLPIDSVFKNKFGSLPDRTLLLYGMLKKAGINAQLILLSPNENGKRITEIATIGQLPSIIVKIEQGDSTYWLCPVDECTAFGELIPEYQGRIGLILKPTGSELIDIPLNEPNKERTEKRIWAKLFSNGELEVKQIVKLYGNFAIGFRKNKALKQEELRKQFEATVSKIHPSAELIEFKVSDLANLSDTVSYQLNYRIKNYALKSGDKFLTFNLPGILYTAEEVGKPERANPMDFGIKEAEINQIEIEIPKGYKIYYLPPLYEQESKIATYGANFTKKMPNFIQKMFKKPAYIIFSDKYSRKLNKADAEDYYDYKKCIETKAKLAKEWIVLYHE